MYRYYQIDEKGEWKVIEDGPDVEQRALSQGAKKVTILAVSEIITESTDRASTAHKGDFFTDIDSKDLQRAILAQQELVYKYRDLQVPDEAIRLYCSGSKGFHSSVAACVFSSGRAIRGLPQIYKEMALDLYVPGLDFQVYSGGKGTCWRLMNVQRSDGMYRVPITIEELFDMTPEIYRELVQTPRIVPTPTIPEGAYAHGFAALMDRAKRRVKAKPRQPEPVPDEDLIQFQEQPPMCISDLADFKVRPSCNFNEAGFQMGIFLARSGMQEVLASSLISRMAENGTSSMYNTAQKRVDHLNGLLGYLRYTPSKRFACNAVRSVITTRPCDDCALCTEGDENATPGEEVGLLEFSDGYYVPAATGGNRRVSTFILNPLNVYMEESQTGHKSRRVSTEVEITRNGANLGTTYITEQAWGSKSLFKDQVRGIGNIAFYGSEDDIQKIKHIIFSEDREMGEIIQVISAGMHTQRVAGKDIFVYVEQDLSINQYRVKGTHVLDGKVPAPPNINSATTPEKGDEALNKLLEQLLEVNSASTVAQLLGWFSACHLKTHMMKKYMQFPLLNLWGNAGAGKSMTATLFAGLNGCTYSAEDTAISVANITPWAMIRQCSSTTTVPRILEEYNKSKMRQQVYDHCGEVMKMAWNGTSVSRGTLAKSKVNSISSGRAETVEYKITSPLVTVSEQAYQMPALKQRSIQVQLSEEDRSGRERPFYFVYNRREKLTEMARAMVVMALTTPIEWVEERMGAANRLLPEFLVDRPRYAYQTLLVGLDFFEKTANELQLPVAGRAQELREALLNEVEVKETYIVRDKVRSEVDAIVEDFGLMANITQHGSTTWLQYNIHYVIVKNILYIDIPVVYALYRGYKNSHRDRIVIDHVDQLRQLLRQEPYCITLNSADGANLLRRTKGVAELDLDKMSMKGLDTTMYKGS